MIDAACRPEVPICGHCGLPVKWHQAQDHAFDAVGGSLKQVDPRFSEPREADRKWLRRKRAAFILSANVALWGALILFFVVKRMFFHS